MLPAIQHVQPRAVVVRRGFADTDGTPERPRVDAQRCKRKLQARIVQYARLLADAGSATSAQLIRETTTFAALPAQHFQAQPSLASLSFHGTPCIFLPMERAIQYRLWIECSVRQGYDLWFEPVVTAHEHQGTVIRAVAQAAI